MRLLRRFNPRPAPAETPWIDDDSALDKLERAPVSHEIKAHARELIQNGYTILRRAVDPDICQAAVSSFEDWISSHRDYASAYQGTDGHYPRLVNFHLYCESVLRLFASCDLALKVQDFCFGYRTQLYTSLFFERGTAQTIHRDTPLFCTVPENFFFGMWIALEPVDPYNGPLFVCPGGHRLPSPLRSDIAERFFPDPLRIPPIADSLWNAYQERVAASCMLHGIKPRPIFANIGDVVLWHPLAPHGGSPIIDPRRTRFSAVFHTVPENVPVYQSELFFNPEKKVSRKPRWPRRLYQGRYYYDIGDPDGPKFG